MMELHVNKYHEGDATMYIDNVYENNSLVKSDTTFVINMEDE